ncbi:hypothetical protein [Rickettsiella massiliensis]|uniref:hypothetical protein n=1 Tax=Rickettsiella massiliensis TaxID=676517 RepID=UPI00029AF07D|nr:hypothetical protein [Rickettsiella massiliensis]
MSKDPSVTNQTYQTRDTLTNFLYSIGMVVSNDKKLKPFATESFIETLTTLKEKAAENTEDEFQPNPRLMPPNHLDTHSQPYHSVLLQNPMMSQGFSPQPQYANTNPFAQTRTESSAHTQTNPFLAGYEDSSSRFFRHTHTNHDGGEVLPNQPHSSQICRHISK